MPVFSAESRASRFMKLAILALMIAAPFYEIGSF
jgi:hypothetical protein